MPIIVITGHADTRTCRTALHNGLFDFVEKGFNPGDFLRVIRAAIERDAQLNHRRSLRTAAFEQMESLSKREYEVMRLLTQSMA